MGRDGGRAGVGGSPRFPGAALGGGPEISARVPLRAMPGHPFRRRVPSSLSRGPSRRAVPRPRCSLAAAAPRVSPGAAEGPSVAAFRAGRAPPSPWLPGVVLLGVPVPGIAFGLPGTVRVPARPPRFLRSPRSVSVWEYNHNTRWWWDPIFVASVKGFCRVPIRGVPGRRYAALRVSRTTASGSLGTIDRCGNGIVQPSAVQASTQACWIRRRIRSHDFAARESIVTNSQ